MQQRIDASYGWQPNPQSRILKVIQNDTYYSFDLKKKRRLSGPNSLTKDFSYDYKKLGKLQGAFRRGNDIYFFSGINGYYIWKSKDGKSGALSKKLSVTKDFYKCDIRYTTPKPVSGVVRVEPNISPVVEDPPGKEPDPSNSPGEEPDPSNSPGEEPDPSNSPGEEPFSDDYLKSDLRTDVIQSEVASGEVASESVIELTKSGFTSPGTTDEVDIDVEPKTIGHKTAARADDNKAVTGSDHKILLSIKLLIISVMISILKFLLK